MHWMHGTVPPPQLGVNNMYSWSSSTLNVTQVYTLLVIGNSGILCFVKYNFVTTKTWNGLL